MTEKAPNTTEPGAQALSMLFSEEVDLWNSWRADMSSDIPSHQFVDGENGVSVRKQIDVPKSTTLYFVHHKFDELDLRRADLHNCRFVYCSFKGTNLSDSDLSSSTFYKSNTFERAILRGASLRSSRVFYPDQGHHAKFSGADLTGADLSETNLEADFSRADLTGAQVFEALLAGRYPDSTMRQLTGSGARLNGIFTGVDFTDSDLPGASCRGGSFQRANLTRANVPGAHFDHSDLSDAVLDESIWDGGTLRGADLRRATARGASFAGVDLREARIDGLDLRRAVLSESKLTGQRLSGVRLSDANLDRADLADADLSHIEVTGATMRWANLSGADLTASTLAECDLTGALLTRSRLSGADLHRTILRDADLQEAILSGTDLSDVDLTGAFVHGISVWDVNLRNSTQLQLVVSPRDEPQLTVDYLPMAQFIYLLLNSENIRHVIDGISTKSVLILGNFSPARKEVLDAIRDKVRELDLLPIMFDFDRPRFRDLTETVRLLAGMCRFIIADMTDARSVPLELQAIVPDLSIAVAPIIAAPQEPFAMFTDLRQKYGAWVLDPLSYESAADLVAQLETVVVIPALRRSDEIAEAKKQPLVIRHLNTK